MLLIWRAQAVLCRGLTRRWPLKGRGELQQNKRKASPASSYNATHWVALAIAAGYGFLGVLWIGYSDQFVSQLGLSQDQFTRVQQFKGWGYVLVTSLLLYLLLRYTLRHLERSLKALRRSRDRLGSLNRLYRMTRAVKGSILREHELDPMLEEACRVAVTEGGYRMAWVVMWDPDGQHLRAVAHNGPGESLVRGRVIKREALTSTSPVGRAIETGKPVFANHCRRDSLLSTRGGSESALGYKSAAAVPLLQAGRVVGAFAVYAIDAGAFDRDEARLLIELGASLNIAIANLGRDNGRGSGAEQDEVTGLPNRRAFERQISWALARTHRRAEHVALIVLDIDGFRSINDTLGREAGDRVLQAVTTLLRASIRPGDFIGRLGSDEFGVLLTDLAGNDEIGAAVDHVVRGFPQRLSVDDQEVQVSVSMGVGVFPADAQDADELFACAELALHNAPSDTRGQISYYEPELNEQARRQRGLELALQGAHPEKDFTLAWQPIIDVRSGDLFGAEALLRWQHPVLGNVPPDVFIPLAELSGQIISIGRWVLEESIRQGQIWSDGGMPLNIHVNVSLLQLQHPGFVDELAEQMKKYKTSLAWKLVIEMTESQFMADSEATASSCRRIKELGCNIDLDDFGTGYSALSYLTRLPLDALKLDRSFVVQVEHDPDMLAVVEAVVRLAKRLGLAVVAEGVETRSHLELLERLECNYAQGYLFGRPDTAEKLVKRWRSAPASAGQALH